MTRIVYNSTDDNPLEANIKINGALVPIPTGSTFVAFVQDMESTVKIIDDISILEVDDGNNWANGRIKGYFPKAASAALAAYDDQPVLVCVRATIDGHTETFTRSVTAKKLL